MASTLGGAWLGGLGFGAGLPGGPAVEPLESPQTFRAGTFSVANWSGYPEGLPRPDGPFRLLEGAEYNEARAAANSANRALRRANPGQYAGQEIHEIQPVKFAGSPTAPANKIALPPLQHREVTAWWNAAMRQINAPY